MVEVISIHIAKTGGRSFYEILRNEYGELLDHRTSRVDYFPAKNYDLPLTDRIHEHIKVIHGHFHYKHIRDIHIKHHSKIIAWLRDPVERVISNYYYMIARVNEDGESHPHYHKRHHTLMDYANDSVPNKMSKCLQGIRPEDLFFAGLQGNFREDVKHLAGMLKWQKEIPDVHLNAGMSTDAYVVAPTRKEDISRAMRKEIAAINQLDMQLYEKVKKIRSSF